MQGLFGGLLSSYEFIGYIARTILLFLAQGVFIIIGIIILILVGRKDFFSYATNFEATKLPEGLLRFFDVFSPSYTSRTDERLINGIFCSLMLAGFVVIFVFDGNIKYINLGGSRDISLRGVFGFILISGGSGLLYCLLFTLRGALEASDKEEEEDSTT